MTDDAHLSPAERRQRQRFAAVRDGKPCIEARLEGQRLALIDLSLDGFSLPATHEFTTPDDFAFELRLIDGFGDSVRGRARVASRSGNAVGCSILALDAHGAASLQEWLTVIVICGASVRLTPADAEAIVKGPSLI